MKLTIHKAMYMPSKSEFYRLGERRTIYMICDCSKGADHTVIPSKRLGNNIWFRNIKHPLELSTPESKS